MIIEKERITLSFREKVMNRLRREVRQHLGPETTNLAITAYIDGAVREKIKYESQENKTRKCLLCGEPVTTNGYYCSVLCEAESKEMKFNICTDCHGTGKLPNHQSCHSCNSTGLIKGNE